MRTARSKGFAGLSYGPNWIWKILHRAEPLRYRRQGLAPIGSQLYAGSSGKGSMSEAPVEASVDDVQPMPRKTGRAHFDVIVSLTAIFISSVSLFVAIQHGKTERIWLPPMFGPSLE